MFRLVRGEQRVESAYEASTAGSEESRNAAMRARIVSMTVGVKRKSPVSARSANEVFQAPSYISSNARRSAVTSAPLSGKRSRQAGSRAARVVQNPSACSYGLLA